MNHAASGSPDKFPFFPSDEFPFVFRFARRDASFFAFASRGLSPQPAAAAAKAGIFMPGVAGQALAG